MMWPSVEFKPSPEEGLSIFSITIAHFTNAIWPMELQGMQKGTSLKSHMTLGAYCKLLFQKDQSFSTGIVWLRRPASSRSFFLRRKATSWLARYHSRKNPEQLCPANL